MASYRPLALRLLIVLSLVLFIAACSKSDRSQVERSSASADKEEIENDSSEEPNVLKSYVKTPLDRADSGRDALEERDDEVKRQIDDLFE